METPPFASAIGELGAHRPDLTLVSDETGLPAAYMRLLERTPQTGEFRDADIGALDNFDYPVQRPVNRNLVFEHPHAEGTEKRERCLCSSSTRKRQESLAQAIGHAVIQQELPRVIS